MALEFMTGATVFALINLVVFLVALYLCVRGLNKTYVHWKEHESFEELKIPREFFYVISIAILFAFFGSGTQPKLKIDVPENRALIDYQDQAPEIVIETPLPRTEKLEGFEPLKTE